MKSVMDTSKYLFCLMFLLFLTTGTLTGCSKKENSTDNTTYYRDADGDGYGDPADSQTSTTQPDGYVTNNNDCDDTNVDINPAATEMNDGVDNNCNGQVDETVTTVQAPNLNLAYQQTKLFRFSWTDVEGETEYRLFENPDGSSGFNQIATISANTTSYNLSIFLPSRLNARYMLQACNSDGCTDSNEVTVDVPAMTAAIGYIKASNSDASDLFAAHIALSADGRTLAVGATGEDSSGNNETDDSTPNAGAVYIYTLDDNNWSQQAYLKASNADTGDWFGIAVSLSANGSILAVGASEEDSNGSDAGDNSAPDAGAVYIYTRNGDSWNQQAYLKAANAANGDRFGRSVALSADGATLAVGASYKNTYGGAVYIYTRDTGPILTLGNSNTPNEDSGPWSQQGYLEAKDISDSFGESLALSADGNLLAVGASGEDSNATGVFIQPSQQIDAAINNNDASNAGAVYLFRRNNEAWYMANYIKASNTDIDDDFGRTIALSADGNTLAIGAPSEDSMATGINGNQASDFYENAGAVYLYRYYGGGRWEQKAYIKASNTGSNNIFGTTVSLSADGNTLAVGASGEASSANGINGDASNNSSNNAGAVYLYRYDNEAWKQQAYIKAPNTDSNDNFATVALSDNADTLAVGAYGEDSAATGLNGDQSDNSAPDAGAVYLY